MKKFIIYKINNCNDLFSTEEQAKRCIIDNQQKQLHLIREYLMQLFEINKGGLVEKKDYFNFLKNLTELLYTIEPMFIKHYLLDMELKDFDKKEEENGE